MEKYITAWTTNKPDDIRALFTEDAVYATRPYDTHAWRGHEQIVEHWLAERTSPRSGPSNGNLLGSDGDLHFVQGRTTYLGDRPSYENLWVVRLAPDSRATAFTEWFMERSPGRFRAGRHALLPGDRHHGNQLFGQQHRAQRHHDDPLASVTFRAAPGRDCSSLRDSSATQV